MAKFNISGRAFLAPMAGVSDFVFRKICADHGCALTYTEMISAKGIYFNNEKTYNMIDFSENEIPAAVQIFGHEPLVLCHACEVFEKDDRISIIDINMGCPAPKIVKNGDGAALLTNRALACEIVREVKKATSKPVTAKIRKGFYKNENIAVTFSLALEESGIDAITVHGRTREQYFEGVADLHAIKDVKDNVLIPVIGNGDIKNGVDALSVLKETSCDYIMVGRGALGNPWIFEEINSKLNNKEFIEKTPEEKIEMCIYHLRRQVEYYGQYKGVTEMRKHIGWYLKGLINSIEVKNRINIEYDVEKIVKILEEYKLKF
ncbi:MAG: tRNA dihydrouridine synthase DusB [Oscillospiraceae bacterium]|nr:tRNA dihydrouridine synthase DusB [Oscillospiraceae bacterium]